MTDASLSGFTLLDFRRALEALRNGVPNRDAVRVLGCGQGSAEDAFQRQLDDCKERVPLNQQADGTLIAGGFGTGKSHLLEYLQYVASSSNFVCSRIVISKETPLYDPAKLFLAAVENAVVPRHRGQAVKELAFNMNVNTPAYVEYYKWANNDPANGISALFPATLLLHERLSNDPDLVEDVTNFWSGEPLPVARIRQGLRQCGAASAYDVKVVPARQLAEERFTFLARLILGAGYAGWVLLIDEVELIGRYSLLLRARSYAELAKWMGLVPEHQYPGLTVVAAITDDFDINVLKEKGDSERVLTRLQEKGTDDMRVLALRAETGMRLIQRDALRLQPPTAAILLHTCEIVRQIHAAAYKWDPPHVEAGDLSIRRAMRSHLRRWINEWDLHRIYPEAELHTEEEELKPSYSEDDTLETASEVSSAATSQ